MRSRRFSSLSDVFPDWPAHASLSAIPTSGKYLFFNSGHFLDLISFKTWSVSEKWDVHNSSNLVQISWMYCNIEQSHIDKQNPACCSFCQITCSRISELYAPDDFTVGHDDGFTQCQWQPPQQGVTTETTNRGSRQPTTIWTRWKLRTRRWPHPIVQTSQRILQAVLSLNIMLPSMSCSNKLCHPSTGCPMHMTL